MKHLLAILCLAAAGMSLARAAEPCPPTHLRAEWSPQCFEGKGDARRVKPAFVGQLEGGRDGTAFILIGEPRELVAVDRRGKVVVPGIRHTGDFDYPTPPLGIGRYDAPADPAAGRPRRQCGYFQVHPLKITVPARFDQCQAVKTEETLACTDCVAYCTETDCQAKVFVGGQGVVLGTDGAVRRSYSLPTLETVCKAPDRVRVSKLAGRSALLRCWRNANDPFNHLQ